MNFLMMQVIISINKHKISPILVIYQFYTKNEENVLVAIQKVT